jgi:hypothetical protein
MIIENLNVIDVLCLSQVIFMFLIILVLFRSSPVVSINLNICCNKK